MKIKSSQVAALLEDEIIRGKLVPGERLKSTRAMAADFAVGQRVIISALDVLERKKLVARRERFGVYVNHPSRPEAKEVMILAFGGTPEDNNFVRRVAEFMHFPEVKERLDFFVRFIPGEDAHLRFDAELARLEKFGYPDCVLIVGLRFRREQVERTLRLSYPALFLGNFLEGDYPDLAYNRLGGDNFASLRASLEHARRCGYRRIELMSDQDYAERLTFREARAQAQAFVHSEGMELLYRPVLGEKPELPAKFAALLAKERPLPELLLVTGAEPFELQRQLDANGVRPLDIITLDDMGGMTPPFKYLRRDTVAFHREMAKAVEALCSGGTYGINDLSIVNGMPGEGT